MTDKDVFISRLRHAAAVRVVPPRRAIVAVDAMPPRVLFAIDTEGVDAFETALAAVGGTVHRAADLNVARALVVDVIGARSPVVLGCEPDVEALGLDGERWPECGLRAAAEPPSPSWAVWRWWPRRGVLSSTPARRGAGASACSHRSASSWRGDRGWWPLPETCFAIVRPSGPAACPARWCSSPVPPEAPTSR